jgi:hypothetical protein
MRTCTPQSESKAPKIADVPASRTLSPAATSTARAATTTEPRPRTTEARARTEPRTDARKTEPRTRTEPKPDAKVDAAATTGADGYLIASTTPWAQVAIDGVPTGKMTPITMQGKIALSPGPHKLTFTVAREKFHFTVKIEAGKTTRFTKDLQVQSPSADP